MRRLVANTALLAALKIGAPLCSLLLVLGISRTLGAAGLGRYGLAYAWLGLFSLLAPFGIPSLLTREGARDPAALARLLSAGLWLGGSVSLILTVALAAVCRALSYDAATSRALVVLSVAVLPSTCQSYLEAAFLALEDAAPIAWATAVEHFFKVGLGVALLLGGAGLDAVLAAAVAGKFAACAVLLARVARRGVALSLGQVDRASLRSLAARAPVFALSAVCATLYWRIDVFVLARLRGIAEVGYYTAAYRILDLAVLLPQSLCQAVFPRIAADAAGEAGRRGSVLRSLLLLTAPAAVVVALLARPLLRLLYGADFALAAPVLALLIWTSLPYAWNRYHACVLVATERQDVDLSINAGLLAANVALNLVLIPRHGAMGAAFVTLATALLYAAAQWLCLRERKLDARPAPEAS